MLQLNWDLLGNIDKEGDLIVTLIRLGNTLSGLFIIILTHLMLTKKDLYL